MGYLTPTSGTSKIFVPQLGTIKEIHINEGQQVREGQPLLTIDTAQIAANGLDVNATMLDTLRSQKDLLNGQIAAEEQRTKSERERLTAMIDGLEVEISQLQAQLRFRVNASKSKNSSLHPPSSLEKKATWRMPTSNAGKWSFSSKSKT